MIPIRLSEIAAATHGHLHLPEPGLDPLITGSVVTDSRQAEPGSLYLARVGEHADGHDFAGQAIAAGALAAMTSRPLPGLPCVVVPDVQAAFAALAHEVLRRAEGLTVIGLTGSSGKTTTKDLLAAVLGDHAPTVANVGSFNNEVGVPLTACRVEPDTRFLIVEMGARGPGHIRYLTDMVAPSVGVVLNVGTAHASEFGSRQATAAAKGELIEALPADGLAVLNADDPLVAAMASRSRARVVFSGQGPTAQVRAEAVTLREGRASFTLVARQGSADVQLSVLGAHQVDNALAVAATALELGVPLPSVAASLSAAALPSRFRMELHERPDGLLVLNDAYNANPESMAAALRTLVELGHAEAGRRTWAVLGEMLELGQASAAAHAQIGTLAASLGVDRLIAVGAGTRGLAQAAADRATWVEDAEAARAVLLAEHRPGDVILVKSSNGIGLWSLGDRLAREGLSGPESVATAMEESA